MAIMSTVQNVMNDIFGGKAPSPENSPAPANSQSGDGMVKNDGQQAGVLETRPNPTANPTNDGNPPNPLDDIAKLFDTKDKPQQEEPLRFSLDPEILSKVSGGLDFTSSVPAEILEKVRSGDAVAALDAMNHIGRAAYQNSLSHLTSLTDKFVEAKFAEMGKQTPKVVRQELTRNQLSQVPNATHPAIANTLKTIAESIQAANPDYSPAQIAETAVKYFQETAKAISPVQETKASEGETGTDWSKYFS